MYICLFKTFISGIEVGVTPSSCSLSGFFRLNFGRPFNFQGQPKNHSLLLHSDLVDHIIFFTNCNTKFHCIILSVRISDYFQIYQCLEIKYL